MATNHYFNHYGENTPDQRLIESLIIESIKVYGIDVTTRRTLIKEDSLYGEDRLSQFKIKNVRCISEMLMDLVVFYLCV